MRTWTVRGIFCRLPCVKRWLLGHRNVSKHTMTLFSHMANMLYKQSNIAPGDDPMLLSLFCPDPDLGIPPSDFHSRHDHVKRIVPANMLPFRYRPVTTPIIKYADLAARFPGKYVVRPHKTKSSEPMSDDVIVDTSVVEEEPEPPRARLVVPHAIWVNARPFNAHCWNCTLKINGPAFGAPTMVSSDLTCWTVRGLFCTLSCVKRWLLYRRNESSHPLTLLSLMGRKVYNVTRIQCAPDPKLLPMFCPSPTHSMPIPKYRELCQTCPSVYSVPPIPPVEYEKSIVAIMQHESLKILHGNQYKEVKNPAAQQRQMETSESCDMDELESSVKRSRLE